MGWDAFCTGEEKGLINMTYADIIQALWAAWQNDNDKDRDENYVPEQHPPKRRSLEPSERVLPRCRLTPSRSLGSSPRWTEERCVRKKHVTKENTLRGIFLAAPVRWLRQLWQHLFLLTCSTRPSRGIGGGSRAWTAPTRPSLKLEFDKIWS